VQISVHAGLQNGNPAQMCEVGGMGLKVEGAAHQHIKASVARLPGCGHKVGSLHGAELGADENGGPFLFVTFLDNNELQDWSSIVPNY